MNPWIGVPYAHGRPLTALQALQEAEKSRLRRCPLCMRDGATQRVIGNDRMIHPACGDELGVPTVLLVPELPERVAEAGDGPLPEVPAHAYSADAVLLAAEAVAE